MSLPNKSTDINQGSEGLEGTTSAKSQFDQEGFARAGLIIKNYLVERSAEFRELCELREKGWKSSKGDAFFENQRRQADKGDANTADYFFRMMKHIGKELHFATGAFRITSPSVSAGTTNPSSVRILDMCMAPGGFLAVALNENPGAQVRAFTLPPHGGGHKVLLDYSKHNVELEFVDITMLAGDVMGVQQPDIPSNHADADKFLPRRLPADQMFDLVLCDGQVLRTHERAAYREPREAWRLTTTQLAIGLAHMKSGGSMVMLLHKFEGWDNTKLLLTFRQFATVQVFKPGRSHAKRSSFYLVVSDIQTEHPACQAAIDEWRAGWEVATFGTDDEYVADLRKQAEWKSVEAVLEGFGDELVNLGKDIWDIQAKALAKAPFMK